MQKHIFRSLFLINILLALAGCNYFNGLDLKFNEIDLKPAPKTNEETIRQCESDSDCTTLDTGPCLFAVNVNHVDMALKEYANAKCMYKPESIELKCVEAPKQNSALSNIISKEKYCRAIDRDTKAK